MSNSPVAAEPERAPGSPAYRRFWPRAWKFLLAVPAIYFLFFFNLTGVGLLGPDEPRYASIGREMARTGDWITPRLWGGPWFEKPALLYWMTGSAFRMGLNEDLAPRLPVALAAAAFILFFYVVLRREFGGRAAFFSASILATCAAWLAFSHVSVTDLPMSAAFSAAMLLALPWLHRGDSKSLGWAAAMLGIAVLAKGLVPLALAVPLFWMGRSRLGAWLRPMPIAAFLVAAAPWYILCTVRNGNAFIEDFFLKHHLSRFSTEALQHQQPVWFYLPVLVAGLYPWIPGLVVLFRKANLQDTRRRFFCLLLIWGLIFFSASVNKLPGYLLPLFPAVAALIGIGLAEIRRARLLLLACAASLSALPVIAVILPGALRRGITHVQIDGVALGAILPIAIVLAFVWLAEARSRELAFAGVMCATIGGVVWLEMQAFPVLDQTVSARELWRSIESRRADVCIGEIRRDWRYGLNYYAETPLPDCSKEPRPLRVQQERGSPPAIRAATAQP